MHRISVVILFGLISHSVLFAQSTPIDSVMKIAASASDNKKVSLYADLALSLSNSNPDSALFFAKKSVQLAESLQDEINTAIAYNSLGRIWSIKGSYHLALKYFRQSLDISEKQKNDSLIAIALNGIGTSYWHLGKHATSLENHFSSLSIREKLKDVHGIAISKSNIGMVYQSQDKIPLAEKYVTEALLTLKQGRFHPFQLQTMHTLANLYGMQGKIKEALSLDEEGISLADKYGDNLARSLFYDNMGNCFLYGDPPDYKKAVEYFNKTLQIDSSFSNKKQMSDSYVNLGDVYLQQKNYQQAIAHLNRSAILADEAGYAQGKWKALRLLSDAYRQSGQHESAYASLMLGMKVKDSLVNAGSEASMAEMEVAYDTEKKRQQITLQKEQLSKKNLVIGAGVLLLIAVVLLGISYYNRYRLKQNAKLQSTILRQQELASKAIIHAEEEERRRIARDLHDGVGQLMSAARMNLSAFASQTKLQNPQQEETLEKIIHLVDEGCREVRQVSHEMIPHAIVKQSLANAIKDFIDKIDTTGIDVHLTFEGMDERFDSNVETVLYRIIQESVNNVIRHARATTLDVTVIRDKEGISATVEDNGVGFDSATRNNAEGIGLKNICTRIEYLKGTCDIDSAPGRGTVISLHIPERTYMGDGKTEL